MLRVRKLIFGVKKEFNDNICSRMRFLEHFMMHEDNSVLLKATLEFNLFLKVLFCWLFLKETSRTLFLSN